VDPKEFLQRLEAAYKAGSGSKVIHLSDKGLHLPECAPIYPEILYLRGSAQRRLGPAWGGAALSSFREGLRLAKKRPLKMRFLMALTHLYALNCDWAAVEREVLPTFHKLKDSPNQQVQHFVIWTLFYMGCCLDNSFRYEDARTTYEEALARADAFKGGHEALPSILHNLGGALLYMGEHETAWARIQEAEPLQPCDGYKESRRAEYYLATGDLLAAQEWVTRTIDHPNAKKDLGLQANGRYVWAKLRRKAGDLVGAKEQALIALELAYRAVDHPLIQQITTLLRELEGPQPGSDLIH
jgi:tetratricopeptide (TPR) repeat protein